MVVNKAVKNQTLNEAFNQTFPLPPLRYQSEEEVHKKRAEVRTEVSSELVYSNPTIVSAEPHVTESTSQLDTVDDSQMWEEIDSSTSCSSSPVRHQDPHYCHHHSHHHSHHETKPTATLSIFDSSFSTRTRLMALASSLAINLFLPFVNGVMLGFGEIFAKNFVLSWLGWGSTTTNVGISKRSWFSARQ